VPFTVTPEAQVMLQNYPWPGNVRELENVVQRAVVLSGGRTISPAHLMFDDAQMDEQAMPAIHAALPVAQEPAIAAPVVSAPYAPAPVMPTAPQAHNPMAYTAAPIAPVEMREEPVNLDSAVKASELQVIMAAIQSTDSRMEAAAKLGISPRTLRYKLAQMRSRGMNEGVSA
jgi:DNA-binding NtrC family response regulator